MATRKRTRKRFWVSVLVLLVLAGVGVGFFVHHADEAKAATPVAQSQDVADLANLGSDTFQQGLDTQLTADISQLQQNPGQADQGAKVTSACQLVGQITLPLPVTEDQWVTANCVDASQEAHPGAYAGGNE